MLPIDSVSLSEAELQYYSRTLLLRQMGLDGQRRLKASSVLVVGLGGLGSPMTMYLAINGVGRIGILDFDEVEVSNLQRQVVHRSAFVGKTKVQSAEDRLRQINPHIEIVPHDCRLTRDNALDLIRDYDLVADGTDNFASRYLINDACVLLNKTNVHASLYQWEGQVSVFDPSRGPCYRCIYPAPPLAELAPSASEGGVFGMLAGVVGLLQATEVVKLLAGVGEPLVGRLLLYDALTMKFRELRARKDAGCASCGARPTVKELLDYDALYTPAPRPGG